MNNKQIGDDEKFKESKGKRKWELLPFDALEEVVKAFEFGVNKYGEPYTYRPGITYSKIAGAAFRHLIDWYWKREELATDSGIHHLAHLAANALMLLSMIMYNCDKRFDNRPDRR